MALSSPPPPPLFFLSCVLSATAAAAPPPSSLLPRASSSLFASIQSSVHSAASVELEDSPTHSISASSSSSSRLLRTSSRLLLAASSLVITVLVDAAASVPLPPPLAGVLPLFLGRSLLGASGPSTRWCLRPKNRREMLNTKKQNHTPSRLPPHILSAPSMSAVDTNMPPARRRNAWWPCISPSSTNTSPLRGICTAPISTGMRAISCTFSSGVKNCSSGSEHACRLPRKSPSSSPHTSSRSAIFLASSLPASASAPVRFMRCGIRMAARVDSARMAITPSWNICADTVCAAAAVPVSSMVRMARITAMKVMFCAMERSCTAAPPNISLPSCFIDGTRIMDRKVTIFLAIMALMYRIPDVTSEMDVAMAAPATPMALMAP
mmetsp:Transcript_10842/g.26480  ORF Transcript_10842/g.26480 Transcript_10842/m.26480 type:complete len:380 (-) Transcript_10842:648-1787(-)